MLFFSYSFDCSQKMDIRLRNTFIYCMMKSITFMNLKNVSLSFSLYVQVKDFYYFPKVILSLLNKNS